MDSGECNRLNTLFNGLPTFKELFPVAGYLIQPHLMHLKIQSLKAERNTRHCHKSLEYSLVLRGHSVYRAENRDIPLKAGDALFIPPGLQHNWEVVEDDSVVFGFMLFVSRGGRGARAHLNRLWEGMRQKNFHQPDCRALADVVERILKTARSGRGYLDEALRCLSHLAYVELFNIVLPPEAEAGAGADESAPAATHQHLRGGSPQSLYETVHFFVGDNTHRPLSPSEVSQHLGLSLNRLNRLLRGHCGRTVGQLIWDTKISLACNMLDNTNRQVKDIASSLGVEDVTYFCRRFRQYKGVSPNEYRLGNRA